jgi:hypothetical protein
MNKRFFPVVLVSFGVFFFSWLFVHSTNVNTLSIQSEDTLPTIFLPISIIKEGNIYLDRFYDQLIKRYPNPDDKDYSRGFTPYYLRKVNGHYLSAFPIMSAILAVPVYLVRYWSILILIGIL